MSLEWTLVKEITTLGISGFIMQATNCLVQVVCNATLQKWGGDLYFRMMLQRWKLVQKQCLYISLFFSLCHFNFQDSLCFRHLEKQRTQCFFSLFRKVVIVFPLTLILPMLGFGVNGVFLAEPISNAIGGLACFLTMWNTVYRKLE